MNCAKYRSLLGSLFFLVTLGLGCATTPLPAYFLEPVHQPHPDCTPQTHLAAVATSEHSGEDAEQAAKGRLTQQLNSQIESETVRAMERIKKNTNVDVRIKLTSNIKQSSRFEHGELVRLMGQPHKHQGRHYALACLERDALVRIYDADLKQGMAQFAEANTQAVQGFDAGNNAAFTTAWRMAQKEADKVNSIFVQVRVVQEEPSELEEEFRAAWNSLLQNKIEIQSQEVLIAFKADDDFSSQLGRDAEEKLRQAIMDMGLTVRPATASCGDLKKPTYVIEVLAESGCRWGGLGHSCKPNLQITTRHCGGPVAERVVFKANLEDPKAKGSDPRKKEKALSKAIKKMNKDTFATLLSKSFASEIPFDEP